MKIASYHVIPVNTRFKQTLLYYWFSVCDAARPSGQHWLNVSYLPGSDVGSPTAHAGSREHKQCAAVVKTPPDICDCKLIAPDGAADVRTEVIGVRHAHNAARLSTLKQPRFHIDRFVLAVDTPLSLGVTTPATNSHVDINCYAKLKSCNCSLEK